MKLRLIALVVLQSFASYGAGSGPDDNAGVAVERWDRVICLATEATRSGAAKTSQRLASGFAVATSNGFMLVTASHAAKETWPETKIGLRLPDGKPIGFQIKDVSVNGIDPWRYHSTSDLAVLAVSEHDVRPAISLGLRMIALPVDALAKNAPGRTDAIEVAGFPMRLGVDTLSPLAMRGFVASRELEVETKWGKEPILFAVPTVGAGTSGGAVFRSAEDPTTVSLVGMHVGLMFDDSGVKLSKIVPSRVIRDFIEEISREAK